MGSHRRGGFDLVSRVCWCSYPSRTLLGVAGVFWWEIAQLLARTAKISTGTRARHGLTPVTLPVYLQRSHHLVCLSKLSWLWASKYIYHANWSVRVMLLRIFAKASINVPTGDLCASMQALVG